jgi:hypothetical protein
LIIISSRNVICRSSNLTWTWARDSNSFSIIAGFGMPISRMKVELI